MLTLVHIIMRLKHFFFQKQYESLCDFTLSADIMHYWYPID